MDFADGFVQEEYNRMLQMIQEHYVENDMLDFDEVIQLDSVRRNTRRWYEEGRLAGFAYVDDYNNINFKTAPGQPNPLLEDQMIAWAVEVMRARNQETGENASLDASCSGSNTERIAILERNGFMQEEVRSLYFARSLDKPIQPHPFPPGYSRRCVKGEEEVPALVELFRAAVGTDNMTEEYRLAMMRTHEYRPDLDWVVVAPNGDLAAYCIGGIEGEGGFEGYLDPVGTHPNHRHKGLGAAMMTAGLEDLKQLGVKKVTYGTSSKNTAMQKLGQAVGFELTGESVWFSKKVD